MLASSAYLYGNSSLDEKIKHSLSRTNHVFNSVYSRSMPDLTKVSSKDTVSDSKSEIRRNSITGKFEIFEQTADSTLGSNSFLPPIHLSKSDVSLTKADITKNLPTESNPESQNIKTMEASPVNLSGDGANKMFDNYTFTNVRVTNSAPNGANLDINNRLSELKKKMDDVASQLKPSPSGKFSALEEYQRQMQLNYNQSNNEQNYNRIRNLTTNRFASAIPFKSYEKAINRQDTFNFKPLPKSVQDAYNSEQFEKKNIDEYQAPSNFQKHEAEIKTPSSIPNPPYQMKYGASLEEIRNNASRDSQSQKSSSQPSESENSGSYTEDNEEVNKNIYPSHKAQEYLYNNKNNINKRKIKKLEPNGISQRKSPIQLSNGSYADLAMKQLDYKKQQTNRKVRPIRPSTNGNYLNDGQDDKNRYLDVNNYLDSIQSSKDTNSFNTSPSLLYPGSSKPASLYGKSKTSKAADGSLYKDSPNAKKYFENLHSVSNPSVALLNNYPSASVYLNTSLYQSPPEKSLPDKSVLQTGKVYSPSSQVVSNSSGYNSDDTQINQVGMYEPNPNENLVYEKQKALEKMRADFEKKLANIRI
ncbi:putative uncharacterized protein DDB_G0285119 [Hydra vulgaris]|uniref:putative uncharacterized protein DDB_G0285119 n=1 Tax=Hydra vulgaris TaxID=6087 RepID=UPI0001925379|nr:putative uncharacterized protein DDB_G0285119 [Hydra vulgaris]